MKIYKTKQFSKIAQKLRVSDKLLCLSIKEMKDGKIDAHLGGCLFKKRIPLEGRGKRGGARTIIAANMLDKWIFLYGYPKNKKDDLSDTELLTYRKLAERLISQDFDVLSDFLEEISYEDDTQK